MKVNRKVRRKEDHEVRVPVAELITSLNLKGSASEWISTEAEATLEYVDGEESVVLRWTTEEER